MSLEHYDLGYGSKNISVDINTDLASASIRFGKRYPSWIFKHKEGETTLLFQEADKILQNFVDSHAGVLTLKFDTANPKLKLWAQAKKEVLGFDSVEKNGIGYRVTVTKRYGL